MRPHHRLALLAARSAVVVAVALAAVAAALALPLAAQAETHIVGSGPLTVALVPGTTVEKSLRVSLKGPIGTVGVWVRVATAHVGDLTVTLVAPDGRTRVLADHEGGAAAGLGDGTPGCKGSATVFTDQAFQTLAKASAPFTGWILPHEPLDTLKGIPAAGRWTLRIANAQGGVEGALTCWRLEVGLDVDTTVTASSGDTTASLTYRELDSVYRNVRLRITAPGATLAVPFGKVKCSDCPAEGPNLFAGDDPVTVRDLDGDGRPEVIVDSYTGGAHCCAVSVLFRRVGARWVRGVAWWGNPGYRIVPAESDGLPVFRTADDTFGYLFTSWASSGEPALVLRYTRGKLVNVTRQMPKLVQVDADDYWQAAQEQLATKDGEPRGLLAAWAADLANLGRATEAFATLDALAAKGKLADNEQMGTAAGAAYVKALRKHLAATGYLAAAK